MHLIADEVKDNISVPLIHIAYAAAAALKSKNINKAALFGTKYTMTKPFYKDKLKNEYGIDVIIPQNDEQETINNIIYDELCCGIIKEQSKIKLEKIIDNCKSKGAKAVILGCTELPNIIKEASVEIIDTTYAHCVEIVNKMLS